MSTYRLFSAQFRRRGARRLSRAISIATLLVLLAAAVSACAPAATSLPATPLAEPGATSIPTRPTGTPAPAPGNVSPPATQAIEQQKQGEGGQFQYAALPPVPGAPCCSTGGNTTVNGEPYDTTFFENYGTNPFIDTEDDHLSTFAMDVDTASYLSLIHI